MRIYNFPQYSNEWFEVRLGKITASKIACVMAQGISSSLSKTRHQYMLELCAEALTGKREDGFISEHMLHGIETEELAKEYYIEKENVEIELVGFVERDCGRIGCSPDGVLSNGLVEFKCPKTTTQLKRVLEQKLPTEYAKQIQAQLWICEKEWCDFVSFDPRLHGKSKYFKVRVERDDDMIKKIQTGCAQFLSELDDLITKLGE